MCVSTVVAYAIVSKAVAFSSSHSTQPARTGTKRANSSSSRSSVSMRSGSWNESMRQTMPTVQLTAVLFGVQNGQKDHSSSAAVASG